MATRNDPPLEWSDPLDEQASAASPILLTTDDCRESCWPETRYPNGWFAVMRSRELRRGTAKPVRMFGRELVAYRGESGTCHVMNAFCPHMGTHLGHGGKVVGDTIRCPFHGWRFDGSGRCVQVPVLDRPPRVGVRSYPVREHSGFLFVWHHSEHAAPSFEIPEIEELSSKGWSSPSELARGRMGRTPANTQEPFENVVDPYHFLVIHSQKRPARIDFKDSGPYAHSDAYIDIYNRTFRLSTDMYGPGLLVVRLRSSVRLSTVVVANPIDLDTTQIRLFYIGQRVFGSAVIGWILKHLYMRRAAPDFRREMTISQHRTYLNRPLLLPAERPIRELRRWYRQFYSTQPGPAEAGP